MKKKTLNILLTVSIASLVSISTIIVRNNTLPIGILPPSGYGVVNLQITQSNISQNICNPSWSTKSIRPTSSYTTKLKIQQIKDFALPDTNTASYEEDHVISLELGGNPTDPKNLWPEPYNILYKGEQVGARQKDKVENFLHAEVCAGNITLSQAQKDISTNWLSIYDLIKTNTTTDNNQSDD